MNIITIDFETFWSQTHSLTKMNPMVYALHRDTEIQSAAVKFNSEPTEVLFGFDDIKYALNELPFDKSLAIGHNMSGFDAMLLAWRMGVKPAMWGCTLAMARQAGLIKVAGGSLSKLAKHFGIGDKLDLEGTNTKGKRLAEFTPDEIEAMREYNKVDADLCFALFKRLLKTSDARSLKLIDATINMLVRPAFRVDTQLLRRTAVQLEEDRRRVLLGVGRDISPFNDAPDDEIIEFARTQLASAPKFAKLLEARGVDVPMKQSPSNPEKFIPALAKTDEGMEALLDHEDSEVAALAAARLGVKSTILGTRIEKFLDVAKVTGGRMPIALNYYGADNTGRWCLTGDHEVLTTSGWVQLDAWNGGEIMQWDAANGQLSFAPATPNKFYADEELIAFTNPRHMGVYTEDHVLPVKAHHSNNIVRAKARDVAVAKRRLVVSGVVGNATDRIYDEWSLRLIVAMHADGYNVKDDKNNMVIFRLVKQRKVDRLRYLLDNANIAYREASYPSEPNVTAILIKGRDAPSWLREAKRLPDAFYQLGQEEIEIVMDEVAHWDSVVAGPNSYSFSTCDEDAMIKVSTLAHMSGRRTTVRERDRTDKGCSRAWVVTFHRNTFLTLDTKNVSRVPHKGFVYCPTTETGFFLCRRKNSTFVTGNSGAMGLNQQNLSRVDPDRPKPTDALRKCLTAPKGKKVVVADLSGIELRMNHFLWKVTSSMSLYQADPGKADLYKAFAARLTGKPQSEITKNERQLGKVSQLGLGFGSGPATFKRIARVMGNIKLSDEESYNTVHTWRGAYPEIVFGWRHCNDVLGYIAAGKVGVKVDPWGLCHTAVGGIKTPKGFIHYPKLRTEKDEERGGKRWVYGLGNKKTFLHGPKAVENLVQHLAREVMADMILSINQRYRVVHTVHDEVILVVPESQAEEALEFVLDVMKAGVDWFPELITWAEGDVANAYGDAK